MLYTLCASIVVQNQPETVKNVATDPWIQQRAVPLSGKPNAEVMFSPRSHRDMYNIIGRNFPRCIFLKNKIVPTTAMEKQHDSRE
jgi:hypothetical protein